MNSINTVNIEVQHSLDNFDVFRALEQDNYVIDAFNSLELSEIVIKDINVNKVTKTATLTINTHRSADDMKSVFNRDGNRVVFFSQDGQITTLPTPTFSH